MEKKNITVELTLQESLLQLNDINGEVDISALGYNLCNKLTGISLLEPHKILIDGAEKENPVIKRNSFNEIVEVYYKCLAVGYGPSGNIVITSSTISYRPDDYLTKDLMSVISKDEMAGKLTRLSLLTEEEKNTGYCAKIESKNIVIYANMEHPEIIKVFDSYVNNLTFAERTAQTICKRNALKQHPALSNILTSVSGEEGFRKALIRLSIPEREDLTKEDLIRLTESENNVTILGEGVIYRETELLTSSSMLGLDVNNISSQPLETNKEDPKAVEARKLSLLEEIKKIDSPTRNAVFKDHYKDKYNSFSDLNEGQLKFIIQNCKEIMAKAS
jgi:hypothetical protein